MRITIERLLAFMVDWIVLFAVLALPQFLLALVLDNWILSYDSPPILTWARVSLTVSLPSWAYFTLSDSSYRGATLGKRLFRLSVRRLDGGRVSRGRALFRNAVKLLPWEMAHVMIFFPEPFGDELSTAKVILIAITDALLLIWLAVPVLDRLRHRALHDLAAATRVTHFSDRSRGRQARRRLRYPK